mmetsp:Transcript_19904/g.45094  ORF Transcript_19904/g.45094 Transcript_19904/m.45094 type:complete len:286 (+) Transcript_19904:379-1236(+)
MRWSSRTISSRIRWSRWRSSSCCGPSVGWSGRRGRWASPPRPSSRRCTGRTSRRANFWWTPGKAAGPRPSTRTSGSAGPSSAPSGASFQRSRRLSTKTPSKPSPPRCTSTAWTPRGGGSTRTTFRGSGWWTGSTRSSNKPSPSPPRRGTTRPLPLRTRWTNSRRKFQKSPSTSSSLAPRLGSRRSASASAAASRTPSSAPPQLTTAARSSPLPLAAPGSWRWPRCSSRWLGLWTWTPRAPRRRTANSRAKTCRPLPSEAYVEWRATGPGSSRSAAPPSTGNSTWT